MKRIVLAFFAAFLCTYLALGVAHAQEDAAPAEAAPVAAPLGFPDINLDDIVPRLTKCWGSTCLMPDGAINAVMFNLGTKKFEVGTASIGAGLMLLFASDSPYGSGVALHLTGVYSQDKASWVMPTIGAVLARYVQIGYSPRWSSGEPMAHFVSLAGNLPGDLFGGETIPLRKARAVRAARATRTE